MNGYTYELSTKQLAMNNLKTCDELHDAADFGSERKYWLYRMLSAYDDLVRLGLVAPDEDGCTCSQYDEHIGQPCNACKAQARKNEVEF